MTYHPLTQETGADPEQRRQEASDLVDKITSDAGYGDLSDKEKGFVEQMEDESQFVSAKQLFWLRDIWDKLL